jgi:hypothetical protein
MIRYVTFLLASCAFSVFASPAGAIEISLDSIPAVGQTVNGNSHEKLVVMVSLDTEGFAGITLLSVAVLFDPQQLSYNRAESTTTDYLLSNEGRRPNSYLYPAITCDDSGGLGCALTINATNQVNVDFLASDLIKGTSSATGTSEESDFESIPGGLLATLVFDVAPTAVTGGADVTLSLTAPGNVIGTAHGGSGTATLVGGGSYNIIALGTTPPDAGMPPEEDVGVDGGVDASMDAETSAMDTDRADGDADTPDPDLNTVDQDPSVDTGAPSPDTGEPPNSMNADPGAPENNCACGVLANPVRGGGIWLLTAILLLAVLRRGIVPMTTV